LHRPTIYTFNTVSRDSVHTWHSIYTIILMQGVEDEQDWVLEIADRNTKITLPIDKYDPGLVITDTSNRRSLWDHLEEDYDDV
jgi:hypothetical protein